MIYLNYFDWLNDLVFMNILLLNLLMCWFIILIDLYIAVIFIYLVIYFICIDWLIYVLMKNFTVIVFNLINLCIYLFISLSYHLPHFRVMGLIAYVTNFLFFFFYFSWKTFVSKRRRSQRKNSIFPKKRFFGKKTRKETGFFPGDSKFPLFWNPSLECPRGIQNFPSPLLAPFFTAYKQF